MATRSRSQSSDRISKPSGMDAESMNRELMDGNSNSNDSNSKEESWVN